MMPKKTESETKKKVTKAKATTTTKTSTREKQNKNLEKGKATRFKAGEKQVKIAQKGGKASGEAKKKKKLLKECFDELLEREWENRKGEKNSGSEALTLTVFRKALAGDLKAFEIVRDTAGQKPIEKVMLAEVDQKTIDEVEKMVLGEAEDDNQKTSG